jgi:hypothetical protein
MANKTITDLTAATAIDEDDVFVVDEDAVTKKATTAQVRTAVFSIPTVKAKRTSTQTISDATWTSVALNATDDWDTHTMHDTSTNNSRITIPTGWGGKYRFTARVDWDNLDGAGHVRAIGLE